MRSLVYLEVNNYNLVNLLLKLFHVTFSNEEFDFPINGDGCYTRR